MKGIVIGIRDDAACPAVVDWAGRFARDADAPITLVHAVPRRSLWFIAGMQVDSSTYLEDQRYHYTRTVLEPLRRRGVQAELEIDIGDAAETLLEHAHKTHSELIAIGGPRHGRLHDALTGRGLRQYCQQAGAHHRCATGRDACCRRPCRWASRSVTACRPDDQAT